MDAEPTVERSPFFGAIRSRTVARLAGMSMRRLSRWHETILIQAHTRPGARGYPRLYSWVDYMKVRAARKLEGQGLSVRAIRQAIEAMDREIPDWYLWSLHRFHNRVVIDRGNLRRAMPGSQLLLPVAGLLEDLQAEGPLGELRRFGDVVDMDPDVVSGNPVIKGTRLEPA